MVRKIAIFTLLAGFVALSSVPVYAREFNELDDRRPAVNEVKQAVDTTTKTESSDIEKTTEEREQGALERASMQRNQMEARKAELEAKLRLKKEDRKEALEGRRLAMCENRQANINSLLDKSVKNGRERLLRIQRFEDGVNKFVTAKELTSVEISAAITQAEIARNNANDVLDMLDSEESNFVCTAVDGANPSDAVKASREAKHIALKAYKDSVINLLHVVKAEFAKQQSTPTETTEEETN